MTPRLVSFFELNLGCCDPRRSIALPRQSPLGIYEHLSYRPTSAWPATCLCINCGRLFDNLEPDARFAQLELPDQGLPLPDLWQFEFECDRQSCERLRDIYTTYEAGAPEAEVKNAVFRNISTIRCSAGHEFAVNDATLKRMERFPW